MAIQFVINISLCVFIWFSAAGDQVGHRKTSNYKMIHTLTVQPEANPSSHSQEQRWLINQMISKLSV